MTYSPTIRLFGLIDISTWYQLPSELTFDQSQRSIIKQYVPWYVFYFSIIGFEKEHHIITDIDESILLAMAESIKVESFDFDDHIIDDFHVVDVIGEYSGNSKDTKHRS